MGAVYIRATYCYVKSLHCFVLLLGALLCKQTALQGSCCLCSNMQSHRNAACLIQKKRVGHSDDWMTNYRTQSFLPHYLRVCTLTDGRHHQRKCRHNRVPCWRFVHSLRLCKFCWGRILRRTRHIPVAWYHRTRHSLCPFQRDKYDK